jgi:hypothetical protein
MNFTYQICEVLTSVKIHTRSSGLRHREVWQASTKALKEHTIFQKVEAVRFWETWHNPGKNTVARRAVSRQRLRKHVLAAKDTHARIEIQLETVFSFRSVQGSYKEQNLNKKRHLEGSRHSKRTWTRKQRNGHCWSRYQETFSDRLKTLVCVL